MGGGGITDICVKVGNPALCAQTLLTKFTHQ